MNAATALVLDAAVIGPMRHHPVRTLLAVLAIALGIALGLSIFLINRSAADEISIAARSMYGLADFAVEALGTGFDESLYPRVAAMPAVAEVSPAVEVEAKLADHRGSIRLIGVDGFRYERLEPAFARGAGEPVGLELLDPRTVFLSASAANELQLAVGDELELQVGTQRVSFNVAGVVPSSVLRERAGLIDIATAQRTFDRLGKLSRVSVRLHAGARPQEVRARLEELAPEEIRVTTPGEATDDALRLSRAYRANLTALALVALFTGGFFVYSTQALAALRRRGEFAVLHAIGMTRAQQLVSLLCGSMVLGVLGSLIGIALGVALASFGIRSLGESIGVGYFAGVAPELGIRPSEIAAFCALGVIVALAGAARPALEASRVPTASALKAGDVASARVEVHTSLVVTLFILSGITLLLPPIAGLPLPGYVAIALLLIGTVAAMPLLIRAALRKLPTVPVASYEIAIAELSGTARYAALSVSAIVVSFSLMVAMAIMVTSFRTSLDEWTQKILPADLYVRVGSLGDSAHLDERAVQALARVPGIERVEVSRMAEAVIAADRRAIVLIARSFGSRDIADSLWVMEQAPNAAPASTVPMWVSEAAVDLHGLQPGRTFELLVGDAVLQGYVQGTWRDYEHQEGAVVMPRDEYVRATGDRAINTVWMWRAQDVDVSALRAAVRDTLPREWQYDLREPGELRTMSLEVFDRTFAITYLLELVAVGIGLFGIAAGISAQVLARRGELGALRHLGFTRAQLGAMLAIEGSVLGALGVLVGLVTGAIVSLILIYIVNRQSFHWSMDLHAPGLLLAFLAASLIACAALIAVLSGKRAMSTDVVRAVKEDW
jgi:putative ABC transport system permease protein